MNEIENIFFGLSYVDDLTPNSDVVENLFQILLVVNAIGVSIAVVSLQTYHSYKEARHQFRSMNDKNVELNYVSDVKRRISFFKFTGNLISGFLLSEMLILFYPLIVLKGENIIEIVNASFGITIITTILLFSSYLNYFFYKPIRDKWELRMLAKEYEVDY